MSDYYRDGEEFYYKPLFKENIPVEFELEVNVIDCTGRLPFMLDKTKHMYVPWTFKRVYRAWGLLAALRYLLKGVE